MTTEAYIGSGAEHVLDQLTTAISTAVGFPVEQRLGVLEDTRTGAPPRMTWTEKDPGGSRLELAPFALPGQDLQWLEAIDYDVGLWARSAAELSHLRVQLGAQLDIYFGPPQGSAPIDSDTPARPGYAVGKPSSDGPLMAGDLAGSAFMVVPVTLKFFAPRQLFDSAPIVTVPVEVDVADASGSDEAIPTP
jgi:hypothetical protein